MSDRTDHQLLKHFAARRCEDSFRMLVNRHSGMVYGTARRIVDDDGAAQELAQNVFIALARKAATLPADISVPGWLHRSAVLEAKNWIRGELRRKRRQEIAGETTMDREHSLLQALTSVLDEALLDLREKDRVALLSRYVQEKSLREVGQTLGVNEDAAQKRVATAVERLTLAFRKRGYNVPTAALTLSVLQGVSTAAPPGLVGAALAASLTAASSTSLTGIALVATKFMSLTKTQTITACLILGTAPVAYQWNAANEARAAMVRLERDVSSQAATLSILEGQRAALSREVLSADGEIAQALAARRQLAALPREVMPPEEELYHWSSESEYVRIPKHILENLRLTPRVTDNIHGAIIDRDGYVSPVLLDALGLDAPERAAVQQAFANFASKYQTVYNARTYLTNAIPPGVNFSRPDGEDLITLRTVAFPEQGEELKMELQKALEHSIGPERAEIIMEKQAMSDFWSKFLSFGKYDDWIAGVAHENGQVTIARARSAEGTSYGGSVTTLSYERLPDELKPYFPAPAAKQKK